MESIAAYLRRKLKEAGAERWQPLADEIGCNFHTLRKFVYTEKDGDRERGLRLSIADDLMQIFQAIERGERDLPSPTPEPASEAQR